MSAYIVDAKTINRFVSFLSLDRDAVWEQRRIQELMAVNVESDAGLLGARCFYLNVSAVNQRYEEKTSITELGYRYQYEQADIFQVLKSLQCWLYQCSEGDVPESALYQILRDYADHLAHRLVNRMPQYKAAEWG